MMIFPRFRGHIEKAIFRNNHGVMMQKRRSYTDEFKIEAVRRWEKLCRYTEDGRIEIDTNLVENAIRPIALGRKNYLFAGSHNAAQRAAVIYSLLASCKKHDVNPQLWLTDLLSRIPTHPAKRVNELLPHRWENHNR